MKPTIRDVARLAEVSISTVSRVINGADNVSPDIIKAVNRAIDELDYHPNYAAQSLKGRSTKTIGLIVADLSSPFFSDVVHELEHELRRCGYSLLVSSTYDDVKTERTIISVMVEKQVEALLIASTGSNEEYLLQLQENGQKIILFNRRPKLSGFSSVYVDNVEATYLLAEYLINRGHTNIALISSRREINSSYDRFQGLTKCFYDKELALDMSKCFFGSFTSDYGRKVLREMVETQKMPTAIITASIAIAVGVLEQCRELDISIPEDLSIVTYGETLGHHLMQPVITCTKDFSKEMGCHLANMVVGILKEGDKQVHTIVIQPCLIEGNSVKTLKIT